MRSHPDPAFQVMHSAKAPYFADSQEAIMKGRETRNAIAQKCLYVWILILWTSAEAFAQAGRGSISGMVTDPTGAMLVEPR